MYSSRNMIQHRDGACRDGDGLFYKGIHWGHRAWPWALHTHSAAHIPALYFHLKPRIGYRPPSQAYLTFTLGPAIIFLLAEREWRRWSGAAGDCAESRSEGQLTDWQEVCECVDWIWVMDCVLPLVLWPQDSFPITPNQKPFFIRMLGKVL